MSAPPTSQGASVSHHLDAIKILVQDAVFGAKTTVAPDPAEFDVLERDVFEIHQLIRSWRNRIAPINQIPPEILALVPDFWHGRSRDRGLITLTHVCRPWRELFVSRPLLWTRFDCVGLDKTRVCLERSGSSPLHLSLNKKCLSPPSPLLNFTPGIIGRLKSLYIDTPFGGLDTITSLLSQPVPFLEALTIHGSYGMFPPTFLNGNISSLRKLRLENIDTGLPWRNMVNLTSFRLAHTSPIAVCQFLDFFKSAPHLRKIHLSSKALISGAQSGQLVPLACLKKMYTCGYPSSLLFDHLLIPVGAHVTIQVDQLSLPGEGDPLRFLDNLRNLSNFTTIELDGGPPSILFNGPNGEVKVVPRIDRTCLIGSLAHFDTSQTERLEIKYGKCPSSDLLYRALLHMNDLRTLILTQCEDPRTFVRALHPDHSSSGIMVCPKFEVLVIEYGGTFSINDVVGTTATRASRGAKLKTVRAVHIIPRYKTDSRLDVLVLKNNSLQVEPRCDQR